MQVIDHITQRAVFANEFIDLDNAISKKKVNEQEYIWTINVVLSFNIVCTYIR